MTTPPKSDARTLREKLAQAIFESEGTIAKWPFDSLRQPYCRWAYKQADALLPIIRKHAASVARDAYARGKTVLSALERME